MTPETAGFLILGANALGIAFGKWIGETGSVPPGMYALLGGVSLICAFLTGVVL